MSNRRFWVFQKCGDHYHIIFASLGSDLGGGRKRRFIYDIIFDSEIGFFKGSRLDPVGRPPLPTH